MLDIFDICSYDAGARRPRSFHTGLLTRARCADRGPSNDDHAVQHSGRLLAYFSAVIVKRDSSSSDQHLTQGFDTHGVLASVVRF